MIIGLVTSGIYVLWYLAKLGQHGHGLRPTQISNNISPDRMVTTNQTRLIGNSQRVRPKGQLESLTFASRPVTHPQIDISSGQERIYRDKFTTEASEHASDFPNNFISASGIQEVHPENVVKVIQPNNITSDPRQTLHTGNSIKGTVYVNVDPVLG